MNSSTYYRGFSIRLGKYNFALYNKVNKHFQAGLTSVEEAKAHIDSYWDKIMFPKADELGIKRGDTMFTGRGQEVVVVSVQTVPLTKNQITVKGVDGFCFYTCADGLYTEMSEHVIK